MARKTWRASIVPSGFGPINLATLERNGSLIFGYLLAQGRWKDLNPAEDTERDKQVCGSSRQVVQSDHRSFSRADERTEAYHGQEAGKGIPRV